MFEFRILGSLEVSNDGGPIQLGGQKQRAVLALLLLNAGRVVPADTIVDRIWGEQPPRTAMTSLQNLVSQLRKLLGSETLDTRPPGYVLRVDPEQIDTARFESLLERAKGAEAEDRARVLREALSLWRGPPLADFGFDAFAQPEIRRLEELHAIALEERIDADLELGRHGELVGELDSLVREHPLRERLRGQLMLALYRSGRQSEALQVYHETRRTLVDELGIEPSKNLQELHGAILRQEPGLAPSPAARPVDDHYAEVVRAILAGRLVPMLGGGVDRCGRPEGAEWRPGEERYAPADEDVALHLAGAFDYPGDLVRELPRVSQFVALTKGVGPLYDELHEVFGHAYEPGPAHRFLAEIAAALRLRDEPRQLIVTTSYGEALERAFEATGEEIDVVSYIALGRERGKFLHRAPDGSTTVIGEPNTYTDLSLEQRTVILKIHGQVDRGASREWESFVVSEDDYIGYLAQGEISSIVPVTLAAKLRRSHFLFLGYVLREWNARVFLHRIWGEEKLGYRSWAVEPGADSIVRELWRQRDVDVFDLTLDDYVRELKWRVDEAMTLEREPA